MLSVRGPAVLTRRIQTTYQVLDDDERARLERGGRAAKRAADERRLVTFLTGVLSLIVNLSGRAKL